MNIRDVECFLAILEHGSLQRAAAFLGVSQPALTKCVHRLEAALNAELFARTPAGMAPTEAALALRPYAVRLQGEYQAAFRVVGDVIAGEVATLRVGATPVWEPLVSRAFVRFSELRPAARLNLSVMPPDRLLRALRAGFVDFGVVTADTVSPDVRSIKLAPDTLRVVARRTHPVHQHVHSRLEDLQTYVWLAARRGVLSRSQLEACFEQAGLSCPHIQVEVDGTGIRAMFPLLSSKDWLGMCPQSLLADAAAFGLKVVQVEGLEWPMTPLLVTRSQSPLTALTQAFIHSLEHGAAEG